MENSKKIIVVFLVTIFIFISCSKTYKKEIQQITIKDTNLVVKDSTGKYILNLIELGGNKEVKEVYNPTDSTFYNITDKIDLETFQSLGRTKRYKNKVNDHYKINYVDNYYFDKNYIYIYVYRDYYVNKPKFFIAGSSKEFEVLGGDYVSVGSKIYCSGVETKNVDAKNFTTIDLWRKHSDREFSIGTDGLYLYDSKGKIISKESLLHYFYLDEDDPILKKYYGKIKTK